MMNFEDKMRRSVVVKMVAGRRRRFDDIRWYSTTTYFVRVDSIAYFETMVEYEGERMKMPTTLETRHQKAYEVANKAMALAWAIDNGKINRELATIDPSLELASREAPFVAVYLDWEPPSEYSEQWFIEQNFPADLFNH